MGESLHGRRGFLSFTGAESLPLLIIIHQEAYFPEKSLYQNYAEGATLKTSERMGGGYYSHHMQIVPICQQTQLGLPSWLPLGHIWAGPPPRTQPWEATLFPPHLGHGGEGRAAPEGHRQTGGRQLRAQQAPGQPHPCTQSEASPVGDKAHPTASDHSGSEKRPRASPPAAQLPQLPLHQCRPRASSSSSEDRLSSSVSKSCCQKNVFNSF